MSAYLGLAAWQFIWLGFLPPPLGMANLWLGVIAFAPLLLPLYGIIRANHRGMIWGGFLVLIYFMIGVMEAWSNPPQRIPALIQVALTITYLFALRQYSRV